MANDRFDHVFVQPASFDASLEFYRGALGWSERFAWGGHGEPRCGTRWCVARDPDGDLIAFAQRV